MENDLKLLSIIEEQVAVKFTGKVNVLAKYNRQYMGTLLFKDGDVIQVMFQDLKGLKAFYRLVIQEFSLQSYEYVVEPEVVDNSQRQIFYPYPVIKNKLAEVIKIYRDSLRLRPPESVIILINPQMISENYPLTSQEFMVLETLIENDRPHDIYQQCQLLDHEITMALVSLRKKGALKLEADT